jgi:hypothetical protein
MRRYRLGGLDRLRLAGGETKKEAEKNQDLVSYCALLGLVIGLLLDVCRLELA